MKIPYFLFVAALFFSACKSDVSVSGVYLNHNIATLNVGDKLDLEVIIKPEDADNKNVSWQSNKPAIASVDNNGQVTAIAQGAAVITVTSQDGNKTADCAVTVNEKIIDVTGITLDHNEVTLRVGETFTLNVSVEPDDATNPAINWQTGNPAFATVADGIITGVSPGMVVITASSTDGSNKSAECIVTVTRAVIESEPIIITGIIPDYKINIANPGDLSFLSIPDQINFLGIYPTASGEWQVWSSIAAKIDIVRAAMREGQKLFVVAGGGGGATAPMHVMGNDAVKREAYAEALVNYAHQNNFDGIDINWETDWSTSPFMRVPKEAYVDLLTRVRNKMNALPEGTRVKKLSCTLDGSENNSLDLSIGVINIVDRIAVDVYDVYGTEAEGYPHATLSMFTSALQKFLNAGLPGHKLLGGVPFYGGNKTESPTPQKSYKDIYNEAYPLLTASMNSWNNFSFNGADLIREKTDYVIYNGYAGMKVFELSLDIPYDNDLSLLRAMRKAIEEAYKFKN